MSTNNFFLLISLVFLMNSPLWAMVELYPSPVGLADKSFSDRPASGSVRNTLIVLESEEGTYACAGIPISNMYVFSEKCIVDEINDRSAVLKKMKKFSSAKVLIAPDNYSYSSYGEIEVVSLSVRTFNRLDYGNLIVAKMLGSVVEFTNDSYSFEKNVNFASSKYKNTYTVHMYNAEDLTSDRQECRIIRETSSEDYLAECKGSKDLGEGLGLISYQGKGVGYVDFGLIELESRAYLVKSFSSHILSLISNGSSDYEVFPMAANKQLPFYILNLCDEEVELSVQVKGLSTPLTGHVPARERLYLGNIDLGATVRWKAKSKSYKWEDHENSGGYIYTKVESEKEAAGDSVDCR